MFTEKPNKNIECPDDIAIFEELRSCEELRDLEFLNLFKQKHNNPILKWNNDQQTRFIDTLIKALPIQYIYTAFDWKTKERVVIDGLERINTIHKFFYNGECGNINPNDCDLGFELSKLDDIDPSISGKTNKDIKYNHPELIRFIETLKVPVLVIRCDFSKQNHLDYLSMIYHRLR